MPCKQKATLFCHIAGEGWANAVLHGGNVRFLSSFSPQALSTTLWALAQLQDRPSPGLLRQLLVALHHAAHRLAPQDVSLSLLALAAFVRWEQDAAQLETAPGPRGAQQQQQQQIALLKTVATRVLCSAAASPKPPASTMLRHAANGSAAGTVALAPGSAPCLARASPQQLANCIWAAGGIQPLLSSAWFSVFWRVSYRRLQRMNVQELTITLSGAAKLRQPPPRQWWSAAQQCAATAMSAATPQHLASMAWAVACLGLQPDQDSGWLHAYQQQV